MSDPMTGHEQSPTPCGAKTRSGTPCQLFPPPGATRCRLHGGASPQSKAAAARRQAEAEATKAVALFGGRLDVDPATALLELVQTKAAEVEFWRTKVAALSEEALVWGTTKEKIGGEDRGVTKEAKPAVELTLLHEAERDLAKLCEASLRAGVESRLVAIGEQIGEQFRQVAEAILSDPRLGVALDPVLKGLVIADALRATIHRTTQQKEIS